MELQNVPCAKVDFVSNYKANEFYGRVNCIFMNKERIKLDSLLCELIKCFFC